MLDDILMFLKAVFMTAIVAVLSIPVLIIILIPFGAMGYYCEKQTCSTIAQEFNVGYSYDVFAGCILEKPNGEKILLDKFLQLNEVQK